MDRKKEFVLEDVATDGLIMDGDDDSESEDDQDDLEEDHVKRRNNKHKKDKKNRRKGKLVDKIERELDKDAKKKEKAGKEVKEEKKEETEGITLKRGRISSNKKDKINVESLRTQLQRLVQSTNPLSKCMDFVNDDLEAMDSEIDKWRSAFQRHSAQLEEEERKTKEQLAPLSREIEDVDKQVIATLTKIRESKAKIAQNDVKITGMLRFVVNQK